MPVKFLFEAAERFQMDDLKKRFDKAGHKRNDRKERYWKLGHLAELYNIESVLKDYAAFIVSNNVEMKEEEENSGRTWQPINHLP